MSNNEEDKSKFKNKRKKKREFPHINEEEYVLKWIDKRK